MRDIRLLTAIAFLFGGASGLISSAAPQAVRVLNLTSFELGLVGAGVPAGYCLSCLLCAVLLSKVPVKYVLVGGALAAAGSLMLMANARSSFSLIAAQLLFGFTSGAIWPFCSAWMLDFESSTISKSLILRYYNIAWTAGTASGMFSGGLICDRGYVFEAFYVSASLAAMCLLCGLLAREAASHKTTRVMESSPESAPTRSVTMGPGAMKRVAFAALVAAGLLNLSAIGTKIVIAVNYTELNTLQGGGADRMGTFMAVAVLSQLAAFGVGRLYEPYLSSRRLYALSGVVLILTNIAFARSTSLCILMPAVAATGFVLAMAFQAVMIAFTSRAKSPRAGTAMAEMLVGSAGLMPLAAGFVTERMKDSGASFQDALRAPFYIAMVLITLVVALQLILLTRKTSRLR